MKLRIIEPNQANIRAAADRMLRGGVVAFPTETVYGLGCSTLNAAAIERVYAIKGRPADNPLIAHVANVDGARAIASRWNAAAESLCKSFWPGPLTLVVGRSPLVPAQASAGRETLAIRSPAHAVAQRLLAAMGGPISAPSANRSGHVSATTAQHVAADFGSVVVDADAEDELLILDGGPTAMGIESTVVDVTTTIPRLLRPGSISVEQIEHAIGRIDATHVGQQDAAPGTATRHYAPLTPAYLISSKAAEHGRPLPQELRVARQVVVLSHSRPTGTWGTHWLAMPPDARRYAAQLYDALREAEKLGCEAIAIEQPPVDDPGWLAISDRLRRATIA